MCGEMVWTIEYAVQQKIRLLLLYVVVGSDSRLLERGLHRLSVTTEGVPVSHQDRAVVPTHPIGVSATIRSRIMINLHFLGHYQTRSVGVD